MADNTEPPDQRLLLALASLEEQLREWANASEANARLFSEDLGAALAAANPQLDPDVILELEAVLRQLAGKLDTSVHDPEDQS